MASDFDTLACEKLATEHDLRDLEYRLTLRLGAMMAVSVGAAAALVKLA
jgi:hypothetical protein